MRRTILSAFSLLLFFSISLSARTIYVDDDGPADFNDIQAAIFDANNGDTVIVKDGIYTGDYIPDINMLAFDFLGKAITVQSENGPEGCVIDNNDSEYPSSGFYFHNNEDSNSVLNGFTITNSDQAVHCEYSSPTITNCIIIENDKGITGNYSSSVITNCTIKNAIYISQIIEHLSPYTGYPGIDVFDGNLTIDNCNIYGSGGGINCTDGNMVITNSTVCNNTRHGGISFEDGDLAIDNCIVSGNIGSGITFSKSNVIITNSTIKGNNSDYWNSNGGGISSKIGDRNSNLTLDNCNIYNNKSNSFGGGGVFIYRGNFSINHCNIYGNTAERGGGICCECRGEYSFDINNCIISCNTANEDGGGIYLYSNNYAALRIESSTLTRNISQDGTAIAIVSNRYGSTTVLRNCILYNGGNEIFADDDIYIDISFSDILGGWIGPGNIDTNPMFVRVPNDGGDGWGDNPDTPDINEAANDDFGDLHLQSDSPCIDAGDPFFHYDTNMVDMDGQPRVMGIRVDMGADEFPINKIIVTKPQGGEVWSASSIHDITWQSYFYEGAYDGTVDILFSKDGRANWHIIEDNISDTGIYNWHLPDIVDSNKCLIKVTPGIPDSNCICTESSLFTIKPNNPDPLVESKWKTQSGNFERTGLSTNYGPDIGCVKLLFETDGAVSTGITIGHDNRIHIACEDGVLYTIDDKGELLWSYDANSPLLTSPTIGPDGTVYVGSQSGRLYAVDVFGNLRWTHDTGGPVYSSPAVSQDGKIFACSLDGVIYALAPDGSELWNFQAKGIGNMPSGPILASPAIAPDGTVYIAGLYDPNLYALDPNDGSIKWTCSFGSFSNGWPYSSPVIAEDGTIYQTLLYDSNLYAIEPNTGTVIWSTYLKTHCDWLKACLEEYPLEDCVIWDDWMQYCGDWFGVYPREWANYMHINSLAELALGPDGTIYVSLDDPFLRIIEPNGSIKGVTPLDSTGGFTLTVDSDGFVYAATDDGKLYLVDANGMITARFQGEQWLSRPVIAANDIVIVSDEEDKTLLITYSKNAIWMISKYGCEDLNIDGSVNFIDFAILAGDWLECTDSNSPCDYTGGETYLLTDIDRDKYIWFSDIALLAIRWLDNVGWLLPPPPPCHATNPDPPDGAKVEGYSLLTWTACPDAISHDVYLGTTYPPPFIQNQVDTIFIFDDLLYLHEWHYWRIDEVTPYGTTTGKVWMFYAWL